MCNTGVFKLHIRCINCREDAARMVVVPNEEGAPATIDELVESEFLARQRFFCRRCDSSIATIVAVTIPKQKVAA